MFKYDFIEEQTIGKRTCAYTRADLMDYKLASDSTVDREYKIRTIYIRGTYLPVGKGNVELVGLKGTYVINPNEVVHYEHFNTKSKEVPTEEN